MRVLKRDGAHEDVSFDKVLRRLQVLSNLGGKQLPGVDEYNIAQNVCARIYDGVKTSTLDELAAQMCASLVTEHPDYGIMAARIIVSNHQKNTSPSFSEAMAALWNAKDIHGNPNPLISQELWDIVQTHKEKLNSIIDYERDFSFDYFGFKTLERSYLMRVNGKHVERPQHMWLRVALGIHGWDIKDAIQTYEWMSTRKFTHATPTLFNAGTPLPQMASCYLLGTEDSVTGMYKTIGDCAQISKYAGGIGVHVSNIRARGSHIRGTNGISSGLIPMLRVYNNTARHINQAGKRLGSIAIYLEPWHADVEDFLELRKNHGNEEERCRDLFTAMWIPDLFMRRVEANAEWALMCPDECPGLSDVYGEEFEQLYTKYEAEGRYRKKVKAQTIWLAMLKSQIETGTPYMLYKDSVNRKSNQKNLGVIKSSNLCSEITEFSNDKEYATCNLASIALASYVKTAEDGTPYYDFEGLHTAAEILTKNINKIIDRTFYPTPETRLSNLLHRPIGIGVQGLADTYALMRMPFDSPEAAALNRQIFATIYHGAATESVAISRKRAEWRADIDDPSISDERRAEVTKSLHLTPEEAALKEWRGAYATFAGSPASQGQLQYDLWEAAPEPMYDWDALKCEIAKWGMRNSLLLAPMPTASTSQILGFNEAFEPFTSNIYQRRTLAGEFTIINKYLLRDLIDLNLWNTDMKNRIIAAEGSVQSIDEVPQHIRDLYKTAWEIKQKVLIDQAADRGAYVCQSQSMNLFMDDPDFSRLTNMHFYAWRKGLKTGVYYLRTKTKAKTMAFTLDPSMVSNVKDNKAKKKCDKMVTMEDGTEACMMCSS
jgi:ribonucleotide reductase alpha subunit